MQPSPIIMNDHSSSSNYNSNNDDDSAAGGSQSSQRSGASLLERIRLQREREAAKQQQQTAPATSIQVPQYHPNMTESNNNNENNSPYFSWESNGNSLGSSDNFFSNAWSNIHSTMETGMASLQQMQHDDDLDSSLLLPPSQQSQHGSGEGGHYSMLNYFMTFVKDVNDGFNGLHIAARILIVIVLLYIAIKLI
ncbi:hypothetical protein MPSEU_000352000 [Mayamaea pseudoterrestris]|nr:hypothetical protein MPSEU_000352000 [Mayamaea pseudoterrestris]